MITLSPSVMWCPPSSVSCAAVRRKVMIGVAQRMISSMATGRRASKSSSSQARCSGKSVSALSPWEIDYRVVSLPAMISRAKIDEMSSSVRRSPSTSAWTMAVIRSFSGLMRRAAMSSWAIP